MSQTHSDGILSTAGLAANTHTHVYTHKPIAILEIKGVQQL